MPGFLLHVGANLTCLHGTGKVNGEPSSPKVLLSGQPALTTADEWRVKGCAFTIPPGKPSPCETVCWTGPATKVLIDKKPAVLSVSEGTCFSREKAPQGSPIVATSQVKVSGE